MRHPDTAQTAPAPATPAVWIIDIDGHLAVIRKLLWLIARQSCVKVNLARLWMSVPGVGTRAVPRTACTLRDSLVMASRVAKLLVQLVMTAALVPAAWGAGIRTPIPTPAQVQLPRRHPSRPRLQGLQLPLILPRSMKRMLHVALP